MRTLVSLPGRSRLSAPDGVDAQRRESELGLALWKSRLAYVRAALGLVRTARRYEQVVLVTGGAELFVLAALLPRRIELVAADWLMPVSTALDRSRLLRRVRFVVVRRSDIGTLARRFGVTNAEFAPFPAPEPSASVSEGDYVYSGGWAHRDWGTLLTALDETGIEAVISAGQKLDAPPNVSVLSQLTPEAGRERMRDSRCVALTFVETTRPSGPTVLLDAMAHGKAIVVTDVGGTRDYVDNDPDALWCRPVTWKPSSVRCLGSGGTTPSDASSGPLPGRAPRA